MKNLFICSLLLLLVGCATAANYKVMMDSWLGAPEDEFFQRWGVPTQIHESDNKKFVTFRTNVITVHNGFGWVTYDCITTLTITDKVVTSYDFRGNNCTAKSSK